MGIFKFSTRVYTPVPGISMGISDGVQACVYTAVYLYHGVEVDHGYRTDVPTGTSIRRAT